MNFNNEEHPTNSSKPKLPRLLANLSKEGQYCLVKAYEDVLFGELMKIYPNERIHRAFNLNVVASKSTAESLRSSTTFNSLSSASSNLQQLLNESSDVRSVTSNGNDYVADEDEASRKLKTTELIEGAMSILDEIKYLRNNSLLNDYLTTMANMNMRRNQQNTSQLDSNGNPLPTTSQLSRSNSRPNLAESNIDLLAKYKLWIDKFNRELNFYKT